MNEKKSPRNNKSGRQEATCRQCRDNTQNKHTHLVKWYYVAACVLFIISTIRFQHVVHEKKICIEVIFERRRRFNVWFYDVTMTVINSITSLHHFWTQSDRTICGRVCSCTLSCFGRRRVTSMSRCTVHVNRCTTECKQSNNSNRMNRSIACAAHTSNASTHTWSLSITRTQLISTQF